MKFITCILLSCLAAIGFGQLTNPLPKGLLKANGRDLTINGTVVKFRGTNLTYNALDYGTPAEVATIAYNRGYNLVRFHKVITSLERQKQVADALYAKGIRFSIDGLHQDKAHLAIKCYEMDPSALAEFLARIVELNDAGLLNHSGLAWICLINEGFTELNQKYGAGGPAKALQFGKWAREKIKGLAPNLLITDGPDGNIDAERYGPVLADPTYDITTTHVYGTHPQGSRYIADDWKWASHFLSNSVWFRDISGKPTVIQEFGSLLAPNRGLNDAYTYCEAAQFFSGVLSFQWASNTNQMGLTSPSQLDTFSISTDYSRAISEVFGSFAMKYWKSPATEYYNGAYLTVRIQDTNYRRISDAVEFRAAYNQGSAIVKTAIRTRYVFVFDDAMIRGFVTTGDGWPWEKVLNFGGSEIGFWQGSPFDMGVPVSSVTKLSPWTLKTMNSCAVTGSTFQPLGSGIYKVNLR